MHICLSGPTDTDPLPEIASQDLHQDKGERFKAGKLSGPISPLLSLWCSWCDYTLPFGSMTIVLLAAFEVDVDQSELSSSFITGLLVANTAGGVEKFVIGC